MKENPNHNIPFHSILNLPTYIIILLNVFKSFKNSEELIQKQSWSPKAPTYYAVWKYSTEKPVRYTVPHKRFHFFFLILKNLKKAKEFPKQSKNFPKGYKVSLTILTLLLSITSLPLRGYQAINNNVTKECLPRWGVGCHL